MEASRIFLPLYARDLGASNFDIGLIGASYGVAYFISSFIFGRQSDMKGRLRFIRVGLALSAVVYTFQVFAPSPMILLGIRGLIGLCLGIVSAALMAYVYENGERVGNFVAFGSLGWLLGSLIAAALRSYETLFISSAVATAFAFLVSLTLHEERANRIRVAVIPLNVIWANRKVYFPFLLRHTGANIIWIIFPLFLASIGASKLWIAIIWGINVGGQFIAMQFIDRFNAAKMFTIGLILSILSFVSYGVASHYLQLIPVQIILAISFSCLFIGALNFLLRNNVERGTAVGLLYSTSYLSAAIGPFLGGTISEVWGFKTVMYVASALGFAGLIASRGVGDSARKLQKVKEVPPSITNG
jgi:MFS family permease